MAGGIPRKPVELCSLKRLRECLAELDGSPVTLMGLGLFGGGEAAARFLLDRGADLTVTDLREADRLAEPIARLGQHGVRYRLGEHREEDFTAARLVVANPAVPRSSEFLRAARRAGAAITSPMNMFLALCPSTVAGVTGSNGKSTTTAMLAAMLEEAGRRVWLGGNIGVSLLGLLPEIGADDVVVLELSSFQLSDAGDLPWSPHVGVVTNVTPNHLSWHGGFESYAEAKKNILDFQGPEDAAVLNACDPVTAEWARGEAEGRRVLFNGAPDRTGMQEGMNCVGGRLVWRSGRRDEMVCVRDDIPLPGFHNVENAMAAAAAAHCLGVGWPAARDALRGFTGLLHRFEAVGDCDGVSYYNDSYSTTPESTVAALHSLDGAVVLIAGGYDKGLDLTPVAKAAARHAAVLITMGQTGPVLAQKARRERVCLDSPLLVREAQSLERAVRIARELSMPGTSVVFSPGCASYDMFENYRQRGEAFRRIVQGLCATVRGETGS